jgi:cytochrome bd-type quinol oxidase subunit 1
MSNAAFFAYLAGYVAIGVVFAGLLFGSACATGNEKELSNTSGLFFVGFWPIVLLLFAGVGLGWLLAEAGRKLRGWLK